MIQQSTRSTFRLLRTDFPHMSLLMVKIGTNYLLRFIINKYVEQKANYYVGSSPGNSTIASKLSCNT